jgi:hypothetical protein
VLSEEKVRELDARFTATEKEAATLWREEERKWAEAGQKLAALLETFGELRSCGKHERSAGRRSATTNSHRS